LITEKSDQLSSDLKIFCTKSYLLVDGKFESLGNTIMMNPVELNEKGFQALVNALGYEDTVF
jgi:hypothetical protein